MPIMQVHYPEGALDGERKSALTHRLTDVLLTMEGGAKTPGGLGFASVMFSEVSRNDWWIGGRTDAHEITRPISGQGQGDWVLVDDGDVIVHLFRPEVRDYYDLEGMWSVGSRK